MKNTNFEKKDSSGRIRSPEELNDYIKTANPGAWLVIAAALILLTSVIVWGVFGSLDTTVSLSGVAFGERIICLTPDIGDLSAGDEACVNGVSGSIVSVSEVPITRSAAEEMLGADEYTVYRLRLSDWNYIVEIAAEGSSLQGYTEAQIITDSVNPISFIFN